MIRDTPRFGQILASRMAYSSTPVCAADERPRAAPCTERRRASWGSRAPSAESAGERYRTPTVFSSVLLTRYTYVTLCAGVCERAGVICRRRLQA